MGLVQRSVVQSPGAMSSGSCLARTSAGIRSEPQQMILLVMCASWSEHHLAATFASWRLHSPGAFLYSLIRDGIAGDVPQIGQDYPMLETAGVIQVVPGTWANSYRMKLLQAGVAEAALNILDSRGQARTPTSEAGAALGDQRSYSHIEQERARLAQQAAENQPTPVD